MYQYLKYYAFCCILLLSVTVTYSQPKLIRVEYYIDTDPGYGKARSVNITQSSNLSNLTAKINPDSVSAGVHIFGVRAKDSHGAWSLDNKWLFVKDASAVSRPNIVRAEYYIDTDPGYGNAHAVTITQGTNLSDLTAKINPDSVSVGVHIFGVRARDSHGAWSLDNKWLFVKDASAVSKPNIVRAEYYIDTDPGYGNARAVTIAQGTNLSDLTAKIKPDSLSAGVHIFGVRAKDSYGGWSLDNKWLFVKDAAAVSRSTIVRAEYYIDTDPGYGNAHAVTITQGTNLSDLTAKIKPDSLSAGVHIFGVRAKDSHGAWSLDNKWLFVKDASLVARPNLKQVEYYIDKDPGYGNGVPVAINNTNNLSDISLAVNISGLTTTEAHSLFIRSKDVNNSWSLDNRFGFTLNTAFSSPSIVVNSIVRTKLCQKDSVNISYQANGTYNAGNVFNVQLSDSSGSFNSPIVIGSYAGTGNSIINCRIPSGLAAGAKYKIRIKSTNPVVTGLSIADSIKVSKLPSPVIKPAGTIVINEGDGVKLETTVAYSAYLWTTSATTSTIEVKKYGSYAVKVTDANACSATSAPAQVNVTPVITASGAVSNLCPGTSVKLTSSAANSYKWNTGATSQFITVAAAGSYYAVANGGGRGDTSSIVTVTYTGCAALVSLSATDITTASTVLNWGKVRCAKRYQLQYRLSGTAAWTTALTASSDTSFTLTGLSAAKTYQWQVRSVCIDSPVLVSSYSSIASFTTKSSDIAEKRISLPASSVFSATLHPNPTNSISTLELTGIVNNITILITDMAGRTIWQKDKISNSRITLPVDGLSAGTYLVIIKDLNNQKTLKLEKN